MSLFNKIVITTALTVLSAAAVDAHEATPRSVGQVLPVVSAHASAPTLSAVRYVKHRHHRHHRVQPVRHVR